MKPARLVSIVVPLCALGAGAVLTTGSADAKSGIRAAVLSGLPSTAAPGSTVAVRWRLLDATTGQPADVPRAFVRVLGPGGVARVGSPTGTSHPDGLYEARVKVPPGGAVAVELGSSEEQTPMLFSIRNDPFRGWSQLYRPLHGPPGYSPGSACPTSTRETHVAFGNFGVGQGWGPGPAYPIGLRNGTITTRPGPAGPWTMQKVLWWVHARYRDKVLIRGKRLDAPGMVRFDTGTPPPPELRIPQYAGRGAGDAGRPSYVRVRGPGCYTFQIDGTTFSRLVVFRVSDA
jgi:hypothetical protein